MLPTKIGYRTEKVDAAIIGPQANDLAVEKKHTRLTCWQMPHTPGGCQAGLAGTGAAEEDDIVSGFGKGQLRPRVRSNMFFY